MATSPSQPKDAGERLTEAVLRELYEVQQLSTTEIGERLGCSSRLVCMRMKQWSIPARSRAEAMRLKRAKQPERLVHLPPEELRRWYLDEGLTAEKIAARCGCSVGAVLVHLRRAGIPRHPPGRPVVRISEAELRALYLEQKLSTCQIAQRVGCDPATVTNKLRSLGIQTRSFAQANQIYPRRDFDGDDALKAYLIGFRLGDLHVHMLGKAGQTVVVQCSSSRQEQLDLIFELFEPYGHVTLGRDFKPNGDISITCYLNMSFDFLLPKDDAVPAWVRQAEAASAAFAAGYIDAEGSFYLGGGLGHFAVSSYDAGIIKWLHQWMSDKGVICPVPLRVGLAGQVRSNGTVYRKDLWTLSVGRKASLLRLIELLEPRLRHAKRRYNMETVRQNILERNARRAS